jgi:hypothetical protein
MAAAVRVTAVGAAAVVVAAALAVAVVVVTAVCVEARLIAVVVKVKNASKYMASLSTAALSLIDVNGIPVVGFG